MKLADNIDRHKISDEFEFRPDRSYLPFSAEKKSRVDLVRSIAYLVFTETL